MNIRDYIEKRAASKRQLRLAKKYMEEAAHAKQLRHLSREGEIPKLPPAAVHDTTRQMELGRIAETVLKKHQRGREAAKAYAMGGSDNIQRGDLLRGLGKSEELQKRIRMEIPRRMYGNIQGKAVKAFGKINK